MIKFLLIILLLSSCSKQNVWEEYLITKNNYYMINIDNREYYINEFNLIEKTLFEEQKKFEQGLIKEIDIDIINRFKDLRLKIYNDFDIKESYKKEYEANYKNMMIDQFYYRVINYIKIYNNLVNGIANYPKNEVYSDLYSIGEYLANILRLLKTEEFKNLEYSNKSFIENELGVLDRKIYKDLEYYFGYHHTQFYSTYEEINGNDRLKKIVDEIFEILGK